MKKNRDEGDGGPDASGDGGQQPGQRLLVRGTCDTALGDDSGDVSAGVTSNAGCGCVRLLASNERSRRA